MRTGHHNKPTGQQAGFSLVELMIALTIGGFIIGSVYAIGAGSTRHFATQQRVSSLQGRLRLAMNQVKHDLLRAGYLAPPHARAAGQVCEGVVPAAFDNCGTVGCLAGVARFVNDTTPPNLNAMPMGTTTDTIRLYGNYAAAAEYPGVDVDASSPNTIFVNPTWHDFQHDFTEWRAGGGGPVDPGAVNFVFLPGRMVRLRFAGNQYHYATIVAVAPIGGPGDRLAITIDPPVRNTCVPLLNNGWIAPVSLIQYNVVDSVSPPAMAVQFKTGPAAELRRTELNPRDGTVLMVGGTPASSRIIGEYVTDFNLWFLLNTTPGRDTFDTVALGAWQDAVPAINNQPETIRAVRVSLSMRTPEPEDGFPVINPPFGSYQSLPACPAGGGNCSNGAARVRTSTAEIMLHNVAAGRY